MKRNNLVEDEIRLAAVIRLLARVIKAIIDTPRGGIIREIPTGRAVGDYAHSADYGIDHSEPCS